MEVRFPFIRYPQIYFQAGRGLKLVCSSINNDYVFYLIRPTKERHKCNTIYIDFFTIDSFRKFYVSSVLGYFIGEIMKLKKAF